MGKITVMIMFLGMMAASGCKTAASYNKHDAYLTVDGWRMHVDTVYKAKRYCCTDDCRWIEN